MKRIFLIVTVLCSSLALPIVSFSQTKSVKKKAIKSSAGTKKIRKKSTIQNPILPPTTTEQYGLPNAVNINDSGGGQGTGRGTGIGQGNGMGSGMGSGNGTGSGTGSGQEYIPPKVENSGPITPLKIISKPRAQYTDVARQNQVTGVVRLRITFLANGQIGSISPVSGLPDGLTDQAIEAARKIRFEPQKKNGTAVTVTKVMEFSFTIY